MKLRPLGRTGQTVSALCFGTLNFGWRVDAATAHALLDAYREAGGGFIQSSAVAEPGGAFPHLIEASEEFGGRWWRERRVPRDELFLATRLVVGGARPRGAAAFESLVRRACESSLGRLRAHHLDLLLLEWRDDLPPLDEVLFALDRLKRAGLVRHLGASGFPAWRLMDAIHRAARRDVDRFAVLQADFSRLSDTRSERDQLRLCHEHRLGFLARSPLGGGLLARPDDGPADPPTPRTRRLQDRFAAADVAAARAALDELAARHRLTRAQAALAWVLAHPDVSAPVLGVSTPGHLAPLLRATDVVFSAEELAPVTASDAPPPNTPPVSLNLEPIET